jgi:hypothetical protein
MKWRAPIEDLAAEPILRDVYRVRRGRPQFSGGILLGSFRQNRGHLVGVPRLQAVREGHFGAGSRVGLRSPDYEDQIAILKHVF